MKWTKQELVTAFSNKILPMVRVRSICESNGFDFSEVERMVRVNFAAKRDAIEAEKKSRGNR